MMIILWITYLNLNMKKTNKLMLNSSNLPSKTKENFDDNLRLKFTAKKIAFKVFYELKSKGLTQQDLAECLKVSPQNISKILKGDDFKLSTLIRIEEALLINLIDRDIVNKRNNLSVFVDYKSFEQKRTQIIVGEQTFLMQENFRTSVNVLEKNLFKNSISFEQSIKEIFQNEI